MTRKALVGFVVVVLSLGLTATMAAAKDWKEEIGADLVKMKRGKMTMTDYSIIWFKPAPEKKMQVKLYAEAPAGGDISRDYFVASASSLHIMSIFSIVSQLGKLEDLEIDQIDAPIGRLDFEINVFMSKDGYQLEMVNGSTGKRNRVTETWKKMYE